MPLGKKLEVQLILGVLFHCHEKKYPRKTREKMCVFGLLVLEVLFQGQWTPVLGAYGDAQHHSSGCL